MKRLGFIIVVLLLCAPLRIHAQTNFTALADVSVGATAVIVCPGNAFRYACNITNTDASVAVRWGDSTITTTKGQQLRAATAIEIKSKAPVYMISEGAAVTVTVTEETK